MQAKASQEKSRRAVRNTWVGLFRGINVGGNNLLPMRELGALLAELGASDVRTYIQSGNVVFQHASDVAAGLARRIGNAVKQQHGFEPSVLLLTPCELARAAAANPFMQHTDEPTTVHVVFLNDSPSRPDLASLEQVKLSSESFALIGRCFYLHAPEGLARSKLAQRVERCLGVAGTSRNWRTVCKLSELAQPSG